MHRTYYFKSKPPCLVCEDEMHGIAKCPTFAERPIENKRAFIRENQLCLAACGRDISQRIAKGDKHVVHVASVIQPACMKRRGMHPWQPRCKILLPKKMVRKSTMHCPTPWLKVLPPPLILYPYFCHQWSSHTERYNCCSCCPTDWTQA